MRSILKNLIKKIKQDGDETQDAALVMGLLIEKASAKGQSFCTEELIEKKMSKINLTKKELEEITNELMTYLLNSTIPNAMVIWALIKSRNPKILDVLIDLFDRFFQIPEHENICYHALYGLTIFQNKQAIERIRRAAQFGSDRIFDTAKSFLNIYNKKHS